MLGRSGAFLVVLVLATGCGAGGTSPPRQPEGEYERLHGDDIARAKELYAAGKQAEAAAILKSLAADENWEVRMRAIRAIGEVKDRSLLPLVHAALADKNLEIRESAGRVLTWLADMTSIPPLLKALSDPEPVIRHHALEALGRVGDASVMATIEKLAKEDEDRGVREAAAEALSRLQSKQGE